jgi:hypothetical protein
MGLAVLTLGLVLTLVALMTASSSTASADSGASASTTAPVAPMPAQRLTARGGMPNAAAKLKAGGEVTVAFIGGPITADESVRAYPQLVTGWMRSQYPAARVTLVNAGLPDGGSWLGAARLDRDVLPHKPDLLFVEFAVDDEGQNYAYHVERLIRKMWTANPRTDVVVLYAIAESQLPDYRAGKLPPAASAHERVAAHYDVPSIAMGMDLLAQVDEGKAKWAELFVEGWRPQPAAHAAFADTTNAALRELLDGADAAPGDHALKDPLSAKMVLYPATRPAPATMPAPPAMTDAQGRAARRTYAMPTVGVQWIGAPEFKDDETGRVLWRLRTQSGGATGRRLNNTFGLDRARWGPPMSWFDEYGYFTGPAGVYLVVSAKGKPNNITCREDDFPIVTFTATQAGRYVIRVKSLDAQFWGLHRALAMNVAHFPVGQDLGTSIAFHRTQAGIGERVNLTAELRCAAGDDLAFMLDSNALGGGGGAVYRETEISVGWFGE